MEILQEAFKKLQASHKALETTIEATHYEERNKKEASGPRRMVWD